MKIKQEGSSKEKLLTMTIGKKIWKKGLRYNSGEFQEW